MISIRNLTFAYRQTPVLKGVSFDLPEGRVRAYVEGVSASQAKSVAEGSGIASPELHLVFLPEAKDTRYDTYGVLRPITSGNFDE